MIERFVDVQYGERSDQVSQGAFGQEDEDLHDGLEVKASENCPSELHSNFDCFESCAATTSFLLAQQPFTDLPAKQQSQRLQHVFCSLSSFGPSRLNDGINAL